MASVNKAIILGNIGRDPETRYLPSGDAVTNISVATTESWKDKESGEKKEATEWHRIVFFGKLAEIAGEYLKKGGQVYVEGRIQTREYEKDGVKRYSTQIVAEKLVMLGGKRDEAAREKPAPQQGQQKPRSGGGAFDTMDDDSIPF